MTNKFWFWATVDILLLIEFILFIHYEIISIQLQVMR